MKKFRKQGTFAIRKNTYMTGQNEQLSKRCHVNHIKGNKSTKQGKP